MIPSLTQSDVVKCILLCVVVSLVGCMKKEKVEGSDEPDRTPLMVQVNKAKASLATIEVGDEPGQYPQSAIDAMKAVLEDAEPLLALDSSQDQIDQAAAELSEALEVFMLAQIPSQPVTPAPVDTTSGTSTSGTSTSGTSTSGTSTSGTSTSGTSTSGTLTSGTSTSGTSSSGTSTSETTDPAIEPEPVSETEMSETISLIGRWWSPCRAIGSTSFRMFLEFTEDEMVENHFQYPNKNCTGTSVEEQQVRFFYNIDSTDGEVYQLRTHLDAHLIYPYRQESLATWNQMCPGYSFALDVATDVQGCLNLDLRPTYEAVKVVGSRLYMGATRSHQASERPTDFDMDFSLEKAE